MGVEKPDLFKQWKMMQDVDRILAEVAAHAAAAGLVLESVREVLLANMLGEQPLPIGFREAAARTQSRAGARHRRVDSELGCGPGFLAEAKIVDCYARP